nr:hypothetical protein [Haliscomenobacter sp.]
MCTVAVFSPTEFGAKVTVNVAVPPGAMGDAGLSGPRVKREASTPVMVMAPSVKFTVPVFCTV